MKGTPRDISEKQKEEEKKKEEQREEEEEEQEENMRLDVKNKALRIAAWYKWSQTSQRREDPISTVHQLTRDLHGIRRCTFDGP